MTRDFDFDSAVLEFGLPDEMVNNINRGPRHTCGLEYRIIPLASPAIRKMANGKNLEDAEDALYVGCRVVGYSSEDNKKHTGRIVNFVWNEDDSGTADYIIIIDEKTQTEVRILPNSVRKHASEAPDAKDNIEDKFEKQIQKCDESASSASYPENDWDPAKEDALYRSEFIRDNGADSLEEYFDEAFSAGKKFKMDRFRRIDLFNCMMGSRSFCQQYDVMSLYRVFLRLFIALSAQDGCTRRIDVVGDGDTLYTKPSEFRVRYIGGDGPVVRCWFHLWAYGQALRRCRQIARQYEDFHPDEDYPKSTKSAQFGLLVRTIIESNIAGNGPQNENDCNMINKYIHALVENYYRMDSTQQMNLQLKGAKKAIRAQEEADEARRAFITNVLGKATYRKSGAEDGKFAPIPLNALKITRKDFDVLAGENLEPGKTEKIIERLGVKYYRNDFTLFNNGYEDILKTDIVIKTPDELIDFFYNILNCFKKTYGTEEGIVWRPIVQRFRNYLNR